MAERSPSLRPRELLRVLERADFALSRQTGSHLILFREDFILSPYLSRDIIGR